MSVFWTSMHILYCTNTNPLTVVVVRMTPRARRAHPNSLSPPRPMPFDRSLEHGLLVSEVLSHIRLVEHDNARRVKVAGLDGAARRCAESEGHVGHGEDDDTLVLGRVLGDTAEVCLQDVVAVQEGELAGGLDPDLEHVS